MTHYLALDWGEKKIGVALADSETRIAFAHTIIMNDNRFFDLLGDLIAEYDVTMIIIGKPQHDQFAQNRSSIEKFAQEIETRTGKKVIFASELFSTKSAQENLRTAGKKTMDDDAEAARVILQSYLDTHSTTML